MIISLYPVFADKVIPKMHDPSCIRVYSFDQVIDNHKTFYPFTPSVTGLSLLVEVVINLQTIYCLADLNKDSIFTPSPKGLYPLHHKVLRFNLPLY